MTGIFDHHEAGSPRCIAHIRRMSREMHWEHRPRTQPQGLRPCEGVLEMLRLHERCIGIHIRENDLGADIANRVSRRQERDRRNDHGIPRLEVQRRRGDVEAGRAVGAGNCVRGAGDRREFLLERIDGRSLRQPVAAQHRDDGLYVLVADRLSPVRQERAGAPVGHLMSRRNAFSSLSETQRLLLSLE